MHHKLLPAGYLAKRDSHNKLFSKGRHFDQLQSQLYSLCDANLQLVLKTFFIGKFQVVPIKPKKTLTKHIIFSPQK